MNTNLFNGNLERLESANVDAPLASSKLPCCDYYSTSYKNSACEANANGDNESAFIFEFLSYITSFHLSNDKPQEPYTPRIIWQGKRSYIPEDLSDSDLLAIKQIITRSSDPALLARLHDLLWTRKKDHISCAEAAKHYFDAADRLNSLAGWTFAERYYHRGLDLARVLGSSKELYCELSNRIVEAVRLSLSYSQGQCCNFMKLLIHFRCGDPNEFAHISEKIAQDIGTSNTHQAHFYWLIAADFYKLAKQPDKEKASRLSAAEILVTQAIQRRTGVDNLTGSALAAASMLQSAIEALRRAGGSSERINELRQLLTEYQRDSGKEMRTISTGIDVSEIVNKSRKNVTGLTLADALFRFAFAHPLLNPDKVKVEVQEQAANFPFQHIMMQSLIDEQGRTIATRGGLLTEDSTEYETALEAHVFNNARQQMDFRAIAYIDPARLQILNEHHPNYDDLLFIVQDNPFVPPGHEQIFLRGLHSGFYGDFLISSHLLTPQIENSIRYILELNGIDVSNLNPDGTQPVKMLGTLSSSPELKITLGEENCFELRGLLVEKNGFDFRNRVAHGFVSDLQCYSTAALNIWWLVLRLCLSTVYDSLHQRDDANIVERTHQSQQENL